MKIACLTTVRTACSGRVYARPRIETENSRKCRNRQRRSGRVYARPRIETRGLIRVAQRLPRSGRVYARPRIETIKSSQAR